MSINVSRQADIHEDLSPYAGSWVAIRNGKVMASALDPVELREKPEVDDDDVLLPVTDRTDGVYIL